MEFDPEDDRLFDVIGRIRVTRIEYENGTVLDLSRPPDTPAEGANGKRWRPHFLPSAVAVITRLYHRSGFRGYTVRCGLGPHIAMNRHIPINFGVNVIYARTGIVLGTPLPVYGDFSRRRAHHEVGAEVTAGLHL